MKKYALIISLLFLLPLAYAIPPLILDVHPITNSIPYNGIAHFQIEITNNQEIDETIYIPTPRNEWDITVSNYLFGLGAKQSKTVDFYMSPPENIKAGKYTIYFEFRTLNNTKAATYEYLNVDVTSEKPAIVEKIKYVESVAIKEQEEKGFLETKYTITIENQGTRASAGLYTKFFSKLDAFFMQANPEQNKIEDQPNGKLFVWDYNVAPGQSKIINIKVSYISLLVAIILIVVAVLLLGFYYRENFSLIKEIILKKDEGEQEKRIKIKLSVANNTSKRQTNVLVQDYIPTPLILTKEDFGTVEPNTIKNKNNKIVLTWKFDVLEPKEERVLSYGMKSKLRVIGKIFLPQSVLYQKIDNKETTVRSKMIKIEV